MSDETSGSAWFSARSVIRLERPGDGRVYEERITLWSAQSNDEAIARAERDAAEYASEVDGEALGMVQAFALSDAPADGSEVYSLMRTSDLEPDAYLARHFDTGHEHTSE